MAQPMTAQTATATQGRTAQNPTASKLLRSVLRENAIFSVVCGLFLAAAGAAIDDWVGLNQWLLIAGGVALVAYGAMVWMGASNDRTIAMTGRTAIAGDLGWVAGALALVVGTSVLTSNGEVALLLISVPVLLFAIGQTVGLRRLG